MLRRNRSALSRSTTPVALGLAALLIVACGGSDDAQADAGGEPEASASAASDQDGSGDAGESVTLTYATFLAENHPYSQWYLSWADDVTAATDGRVQFENFWSDTLLEFSELAPGAADGRADLVNTSTSYNPDMFPLSEILSVPFATPQIGAALAAVSDMYDNYEPYRQEFEANNLRPLHWQPAGTNVLGSAEPVDSLDDLAGLSIRSGSFYTRMAQEAGANPISMPLGEVYQSVQTGLVDAWMTPLENAEQFNLAEVTPYLQDPGMGTFGLVTIAINLDVWNSLSDSDRQTIDEISQDYNERFIEDLLKVMDAEACASVQEMGAEPRVWSDEAQQDARDRLGELFLNEFIEQAEDAGAPGTEFAAQWASYQEDYDGNFGTYPGSIAPCVGG